MTCNNNKHICFGTDGIRGVANRELTPELALLIGKCTAHRMCSGPEGAESRVMVAKDTRVSGDMLEAALVAGILSTGADVWRIGVAPTPALAYLTKYHNCDCGLMISASHNPVEDNGIKVFCDKGFKLEASVEESIESLMSDWGKQCRSVGGGDVGYSIDKTHSAGDYVEFVRGLLEGVHFKKPVVVDCAYGAASRYAKRVFKYVSSEMIFMNSDEDGKKINVDCGSTRPEGLQKKVLKHGAALGFAFDGDGDRIIFVDERGGVVDGDQVMLLCARSFLDEGRLAGDTVVSTVMSNMALEKAIEKLGGRMLRTPVGDKYVLREMQQKGYILGGEQSGHIIFLDRSTTGDGLLTAAEVLKIVARDGRPFSEQTLLERSAQFLKNVRVPDKQAFYDSSAITAKVEEVEQRLGKEGRVVVRPSGTEPLIRVMVESWDNSVAESYTDEIIDTVKEEFKLS